MGKKERISRLFEASQIGDSRIEIISDKRIFIEGCYGINEYTSECIKINMPKGSILIIGTDLEICLMKERGITIEGKILSLEFEGGAI